MTVEGHVDVFVFPWGASVYINAGVMVSSSGSDGGDVYGTWKSLDCCIQNVRFLSYQLSFHGSKGPTQCFTANERDTA